MLESLCTIATKQVAKELSLMLYSLRQWDKSLPVYVYGDRHISEQFKDDEYTKFFDNIRDREYKQTGANQQNPDFFELVLQKSHVMDAALLRHGNTLFVDSDIIFTAKPEFTTDRSVLLSPHHLSDSQEKSYGKYNAGYVWSCHEDFPEWWRRTSIDKPGFYEQKTLDDTSQHFTVERLTIHHNFAWYHLSPEHSPWWSYNIHQFAMNDAGHINDGNYDPDTDLGRYISFHTHLNNPEARFANINKMLIDGLRWPAACDEYKRIYEHACRIGLIGSV